MKSAERIENEKRKKKKEGAGVELTSDRKKEERRGRRIFFNIFTGRDTKTLKFSEPLPVLTFLILIGSCS
jgi:hypothetical protein